MYKKILLPVDVFEMDLSDKAVRHAEFLASAENGEITLLNVLPNSSRSLLRGFTADIRKFEAYMKEESEKKMREVARLFAIPMTRIHTRVVFGNVRDEILAISNNRRVRCHCDWFPQTGDLHPSAGLQRRVNSALRQNAGIGR